MLLSPTLKLNTVVHWPVKEKSRRRCRNQAPVRSFSSTGSTHLYGGDAATAREVRQRGRQRREETHTVDGFQQKLFCYWLFDIFLAIKSPHQYCLMRAHRQGLNSSLRMDDGSAMGNELASLCAIVLRYLMGRIRCTNKVHNGSWSGSFFLRNKMAMLLGGEDAGKSCENLQGG